MKNPIIIIIANLLLRTFYVCVKYIQIYCDKKIKSEIGVFIE